MIIQLDADGVLFHFTRSFLEYFGRPLTDEADIDQFDIVKALGDRLPTDAYARFGEAVTRLNACSTIPPYDGAADFVAALQAAGHEVHACTSPFNAAWLPQRARALERLGIPLKRQTHTWSKHLVHGDLLIDDNWQHCHDWVCHGPNRQAALFDRPWNRQPLDSIRVFRACTYAGVLRQLGCAP